jgi:flagella basal body P-ring formation protein FlgA
MDFRKAILIIVTCVLCTTARSAQTLSAQIQQIAQDELEKVAAASGLSEPEFDLAVVSSRPAPACSVAPAIEAADTRQPARMRFVARCRPDSTVLADNGALERRDITNIADPVGVLANVVGQSSRRSLRAGDVLRAGSLAAPVVVKRGDGVVMVARQDGIEVSMAGEALDAGARGAVVRVKNSASGQVVRMRVVGAGAVQPLDLPLAE